MDQSSGINVDKPSSDPFLSDDFYPLAQAHKAILAALRADETSPDADLYRRIASGSTSMNGTSTKSSTTAAHDPYGSSVSHGYRSLSSTSSSNTLHSQNHSLTPATATSAPTTTTPSSSFRHVHSTLGSPSFMSPRQSSLTRPSNDTTTAAAETKDATPLVTRQLPTVHSTLDHAASIPLPPYLTNIIKETKLSSLMGILPDANMVWVSVDDALYLWEYDSSLVVGRRNSGRYKEDFVCFKVPSGQCVVSVGIGSPKKGMSFFFQDGGPSCDIFCLYDLTFHIYRCIFGNGRMVSSRYNSRRSYPLCFGERRSHSSRVRIGYG